MMDANCINLQSKKLIINQDENGNKKDDCYSSDGNCKKCRYHRECDWFLIVNGFKD